MRAEDGRVIDPTADAPPLDDLLPIEMLVARLQATRSQTMLFEKLIDSERFAGLGQLAGNVTQQLNRSAHSHPWLRLFASGILRA